MWYAVHLIFFYLFKKNRGFFLQKLFTMTYTDTDDDNYDDE